MTSASSTTETRKWLSRKKAKEAYQGVDREHKVQLQARYIYSSFTKQDYFKPVKYMKDSYTQLNSDRALVTQGARTSYDDEKERKERTQTLSPSEYFNSLSLMASTMLSWRHSVVTSTLSRLRYPF